MVRERPGDRGDARVADFEAIEFAAHLYGCSAHGESAMCRVPKRYAVRIERGQSEVEGIA